MPENFTLELTALLEYINNLPQSQQSEHQFGFLTLFDHKTVILY